MRTPIAVDAYFAQCSFQVFGNDVRGLHFRDRARIPVGMKLGDDVSGPPAQVRTSKFRINWSAIPPNPLVVATLC
jgi:hypothetical protein